MNRLASKETLVKVKAPDSTCDKASRASTLPIESVSGGVSDLAKDNLVFGYQLLLDLYNCKPGACEDIDLCYKFLDEIVGYLGMEKQAPPYIFRSDGVRFPDKAGLSGWAPLIESSIVIHTLTPKNFISIDIYCCKQFDIIKAKKFTRSFFLPEKMDEQFIERGRDYYR